MSARCHRRPDATARRRRPRCVSALEVGCKLGALSVLDHLDREKLEQKDRPKEGHGEEGGWVSSVTEPSRPEIKSECTTHGALTAICSDGLRGR